MLPADGRYLVRAHAKILSLGSAAKLLGSQWQNISVSDTGVYSKRQIVPNDTPYVSTMVAWGSRRLGHCGKEPTLITVTCYQG